MLKPLEDITYNKTVKWVELELRDFCAYYSKRGVVDATKISHINDESLMNENAYAIIKYQGSHAGTNKVQIR